MTESANLVDLPVTITGRAPYPLPCSGLGFRPALASSSAASRCEADTRAGALRRSLAWSRSDMLDDGLFLGLPRHAAQLPERCVGVDALASQLLGERLAPVLQVGLAWVEPHAVRVNGLDGQVNVRRIYTG